jgi:hypothetical protein
MLVNTMAKQAKRRVKFAVLVNMLQILAEQQIAIKVALLENTSVIRQQQPNTTTNQIVKFAVLANIRQLQVLENAPSVAPVNILIHLKEQQIVTFVLLASTSVIRQQLPNTTKNPIVLSAVLVNMLHLLVQRIVSCVLPASTSMVLLRQLATTIKNPIVSCAVLVHIQQPQGQWAANSVSKASTIVIQLPQPNTTKKPTASIAVPANILRVLERSIAKIVQLDATLTLTR